MKAADAAKPITVLLAEDHTVVREGLRKLLEGERGIMVVGEAATGRLAVRMTGKTNPDVIVMDIAMPLLNGLEATRQIRQAHPEVKILILSAHSDDAYVDSAIESGAAGYLIKQTSAQFLSEAIRQVHKGKTYFSPAVSKRLQHRHTPSIDRLGQPKSHITHLSSREREVLQLVAEGAANKQIAAELGISIKTVEKHRDHLMQKLDIHDTAGLTRYAIAAGVIDADVPLTIL